MEFLHPAWSRGLADPFPMGVEPAPRVEPAVATHLDASHRVFPPLKLMSRHQETPWQEHSSAHHTGHMQRKEEALGDKTFSHNLMVPCVVGKGQHSTHRSDAPNGTVRVLDAARIADCRSCPLRMPCPGPVSYTHLTLPTNRQDEITV